MITYLLYDLLPVWLAKLGKLAQASALYRLLATVWRFFAELVENSFCARLWVGSETLRARFESSLLFAWVDAVIRWLTEFVGKCFGWVVEPICTSRINRTLSRMPRYDLGWLYGIVFLVCYLCPDWLWRNQYALLLSGLLFGATLLDAWNRDQSAFRVRDVGFWMPIFAFAAGLAVINAYDRGEALRVFCFYLSAFLFCVSLVGTVTNRGRLMSILGFVYLTLLLTAAYAIVQRIQGVEVSASLTDLRMNAGMPGRVYSTLENPNNYAEFIVLTFPVSLIFCTGIVDRRWRTICTASLMVPVVALLMTYSRSGWVSFALAAVVFLALWDKRLLPLVVVAAVVALPILPDSVFNRILTIGNTADSSNRYRLYIWTSVLQMLGDHGLTGIGLGPGNFIPLYAGYSSPMASVAYHSHMLYLEVWLEMGLIGIVSFLGMYLGIVRRGLRAIRHADPLVRHVLIAAISSLAGVSFVGAAEYIWFYPRVMFAFFIVLGVTLAAVKLAEESK